MKASLIQFVRRYMADWSSGDPELYARNFMPDAGIYFKGRGSTVTIPLRSFVLAQALFHAARSGKLVERATAIWAQSNGHLARVIAEYDMTEDGNLLVSGCDRFWLRKKDGHWKISKLVFTKTPCWDN